MHVKKICLYCVEYFHVEKFEAHFNDKHFCEFCDIPVPSIASHKHTKEPKKCKFCDTFITHSRCQGHFSKCHFRKQIKKGILNYECLDCKESFKIYDEIRSHVLNNHQNKNSKIKSNPTKRKKM